MLRFNALCAYLKKTTVSYHWFNKVTFICVRNVLSARTSSVELRGIFTSTSPLIQQRVTWRTVALVAYPPVPAYVRAATIVIGTFIEAYEEEKTVVGVKKVSKSSRDWTLCETCTWHPDKNCWFISLFLSGDSDWWETHDLNKISLACPCTALERQETYLKC